MDIDIIPVVDAIEGLKVTISFCFLALCLVLALTRRPK